MGTEQFCLRWNDFHQNITSAFSDIRDDEDFLDVTLVCDGDTVKAHRLVLSACSPLFRVMLKKNSHPQPMIFLRGIRYPDMVAILNFMYHGEVNVNQEDLQMFLAAAEELRIKGLSQTSTDSKVDSSIVPKKKIISLPSSTSLQAEQPPTKKLRESSPGISPVSTPVSAKSPIDHPDHEDESEPPQLSVKREFKSRDQNRDQGDGAETDDENSQQNNILDCLVQAQQTFQQTLQQQGGGQGASPNFEQNHVNNYNSPQHIMPGGGGTSALGSSQGDKGLLQFLGQNSANVSSAAANAIMMQRLLGTGYELHPLGSRKDNDPMAHIKVARSSKGWHCPQCIHISSTKGNLKSHILSGRHKTYTEKPFGCQYCDRSYGTKQSLQVHISTNHRAERDAEYQALSKSLGMKNFPDPGFYIKQEMGFDTSASLQSYVQSNPNLSPVSLQSLVQSNPNLAPAALQQLQHLTPLPQLPNNSLPTSLPNLPTSLPNHHNIHNSHPNLPNLPTHPVSITLPNTPLTSKTVSSLSILKADSALAHQAMSRGVHDIEDSPEASPESPVSQHQARAQQAAVAAVQKQNLQHINSNHLSNNLASCRLEGTVLKAMDMQKLANMQMPGHNMHHYQEDHMMDDEVQAISHHKGNENYPAPSLHPDDSDSDDSRGPLTIASVEANMDTSITTP